MTQGEPPHHLSIFSFLAEGGSTDDAEAPQGAKNVYDPDHRSVQVCLPGPHPVSPKLQTHLTPASPTSVPGRGTQLHLTDGETPPDNICFPAGHRWPEQAGHRFPEGGSQDHSQTSCTILYEIIYFFLLWDNFCESS